MITNKEIQRIAKLAKFNFIQEELDNFAQQLTGIMNMIDILNEVDCSNIQPLASVCDMQQRMRSDSVSDGNRFDELATNLPDSRSELAKEVKCFVVPKIVE